MCVGGAVGVVKPTPPHWLDLGPTQLVHLICYTLPSVSAWESAAAISITYWGGESFILPGSNPESIDERVGGGGGQCEVVELAQRAVVELGQRSGRGSRPGVEPGSPRACSNQLGSDIGAGCWLLCDGCGDVQETAVVVGFHRAHTSPLSPSDGRSARHVGAFLTPR